MADPKRQHEPEPVPVPPPPADTAPSATGVVDGEESELTTAPPSADAGEA